MTQILVVPDRSFDGAVSPGAAELIGAASAVGTPVVLAQDLHGPRQHPLVQREVVAARAEPDFAILDTHLGADTCQVVLDGVHCAEDTSCDHERASRA